jgi:hypothetical protein
MSIALPNGSRIVGLPGNEATRVTDELYRSMRPALAVADGDLWLMSTPNGTRGFFWEEWDAGGGEWERIAVPASDCPRISARFLAEEQAKGDQW